jgi:mycoredoxin-dependent peroxiredoxin
MSVQTGDRAPDFELTDQHGQKVRLSDFRGKQDVVLVFYPYAFSGICTSELCELRDNLDVFTDSSVQVIGISCDPMYTLRAYAEAEGYAFPLLSDFWPHGEVGRAYGVFEERAGRSVRGSFLVDKAGAVRWSVVNKATEARPLAAYKEAIAAL